MAERIEITGKEIDFETIKESFNTYMLADGNTLKVKCVLMKVLRTDKTDPEGVPQYLVKTHIAFSASKP